MWYWHLLAGFMMFLATAFMISSFDSYMKTKKGNWLQFLGLALYLGSAMVYSIR